MRVVLTVEPNTIPTSAPLEKEEEKRLVRVVGDYSF
jgi:hypothetical protein